jgi:hypothetical protein
MTANRYELWESADGTESAVTLADHPDKAKVTVDSAGSPMTRVKAFVASSWEEALQVRNDHYGWGPYSTGE